jgi:hypothetical protein
MAGFVILLVNRLLLIDSTVPDAQSRADIISVIACSALLLNILSESDIVARDGEPVALVGNSLNKPLVFVKDDESVAGDRITWLINTILSSTPTSSVHVISQFNGKDGKDGVCSKVLGRGGIVGSGDNLQPTLPSDLLERMPILKKAVNNNEEIYLPDLQILPGRIEFTYLPMNAQSVLILPLGGGGGRGGGGGGGGGGEGGGEGGGVVVVATNQAKVLKVKDLGRIRSVIRIYKKVASQAIMQ